MSDVTRFPASPEAEQRLREREEAQRIQEGRAREEAARIRERQAKLEHARNACARRPKMVRETERKHVASNLWQLLEYFKNLPDGPRPADVLVAAKCSQNGDSTKRLPRYALRPNGDGKELVQKIEAYVKIARKAAELAKEDPDDAELRVLSGSSYLSNLPEVRPQDPDGEAAEMIAKGLMGIATRLGEKHDLRGYFAQCERQRITPSGSSGAAPRPTLARWFPARRCMSMRRLRLSMKGRWISISTPTTSMATKAWSRASPWSFVLNAYQRWIYMSP
jgi:hypothetical protein